MLMRMREMRLKCRAKSKMRRKILSLNVPNLLQILKNLYLMIKTAKNYFRRF